MFYRLSFCQKANVISAYEDEYTDCASNSEACGYTNAASVTYEQVRQQEMDNTTGNMADKTLNIIT